MDRRRPDVVSAPSPLEGPGPSTGSPSLPFLDDAYLTPYFHIVAPRRGERPLHVGVPGGKAWFSLRGLGPFQVAELPGTDFADYMDLQYETPEAAAVLLEAILARPDIDLVVLRNVPGTSPTAGLVPALARRRGWLSFVRLAEVAPYADLQGTWETFSTSQRHRKSRYNLQRSARRLAEMGKLEITHYTSPQEVAAHLEEAFQLYARRRQGVDSPWRFAGAVGRRFYHNAGLALAQKGILDLVFLRLDGAPVAFAYNLRYDGVYYYYMIGITDHPEVVRLSPGSILLEHLLEEAFSQGLHRFDFMLGGEPYKALWATGQQPVYTLVLARRAPRSTAAWLALTARLRLRDWVRHSPRRRAVAARLLRLLPRRGR